MYLIPTSSKKKKSMNLKQRLYNYLPVMLPLGEVLQTVYNAVL